MRGMLFVILVAAGIVANAQNIPKDWQVSLERSGCLGGCPSYKITILGNGSVAFRNRDGESQTDKLSIKEVRQLVGQLEPELFFKQSDDYRAEQDCDGPHETDWPSEIISITSDGRTRTITHNEGCKIRPKTFLSKVIELAETIDRLTNGMFIKN